MLLNVCSPISGSFYLKHKPLLARPYLTSSRLAAHSPSSRIRSSWRLSQEQKLWSSREKLIPSLSAASALLLNGEQGSLLRTNPVRPTRCRSIQPPKAAKDVPTSLRYPAMTRKPKWWWRTLACLPYLIPLHQTWVFAETAYHLHPFLEQFEFLTGPFLGVVGRLPHWLFIAYILVACSGIARKKEWPHLFRFHVMMGILLDIALQVIGTGNSWMPKAVYWGKLGMHFWTAVTFAYLFTVLECIRCALAGMYADVPFVCDAAYMQIPYE